MIKIIILIVCSLILSMDSIGQDQRIVSQNSADKLLSEGSKLRIAGYAQIDYNQPIEKNVYTNGKLDVHRLVLLFNYKFSKKTQFLTEVEFEHVKEVYIEQAFLQHRFSKMLNFRAGLMLVPMGIINEYHEPTTFNGVERPNLDKYIIPSTWREIGAGFKGRAESLSLKYQAYIFNGFKSYDDEGLLSSKNGLRSGRQKGVESIISSPNLSSKIDFYGIPNLNIGVASYFGKTQSTFYDGLNKNDPFAVSQADSTVIGVNMFASDVRYNISGLTLKGQYVLALIQDTEAYNTYTASDMGDIMSGFYLEVSYDLLSRNKSIKTSLIPFVRYEHYNTQTHVSDNFSQNLENKRTDITLGVGYKLSQGSILKADYQWLLNGEGDINGMINFGVGVWFN